MQVIKDQLTQLGKLDRCEFVYNGQEAVVRVSELLQQDIEVGYVLTDFMMPRLNGIQAVQKIKNFIKTRNGFTDKKVAEPKFVFLTAYKTSAFDKHIQDLNVSEVYEKPLALD